MQGIFGNGDLMVKNSDGSGSPTALVANVAGRFDGNPEWTRNPSPTCQGATVTVSFNTPTAIPLACVDPGAENNPVTFSIVSPAGHGSLGVIANNTVTYTPQVNFSGTDSFNFSGNDGTSDSNAATVHITVSPDAPAAISSPKLSASRWRLGSRLPHVSRGRPPVGTTISFTLSKTARVTLTFAKALAGRRSGHRCVAPNRSNRKHTKCTRFVASGSISFNGRAGTNRVAFQGRISRSKKLNVGSYRLTVDATDSFGTRSRSRTANFTIVT